jgi:hypothetical protein
MMDPALGYPGLEHERSGASHWDWFGPHPRTTNLRSSPSIAPKTSYPSISAATCAVTLTSASYRM